MRTITKKPSNNFQKIHEILVSSFSDNLCIAGLAHEKGRDMGSRKYISTYFDQSGQISIPAKMYCRILAAQHRWYAVTVSSSCQSMSSSSTVAGILCVYWTWISQLQSTSRLVWQLAHQIPGSITGILPGLIHANGVCRPGMISSISIWPRPAAIHARLQIQKQWNRLDGRMTLAGEALRVLGVTSWAEEFHFQWLQKRAAVESNGATRLSASQNGGECSCH